MKIHKVWWTIDGSRPLALVTSRPTLPPIALLLYKLAFVNKFLNDFLVESKWRRRGVGERKWEVEEHCWADATGVARLGLTLVRPLLEASLPLASTAQVDRGFPLQNGSDGCGPARRPVTACPYSGGLLTPNHPITSYTAPSDPINPPSLHHFNNENKWHCLK